MRSVTDPPGLANKLKTERNKMLESKGTRTQPAYCAVRNRGGTAAWAASLATLLFFLFSAPSTRADQHPVGCSGSGLGINMFTSSPDVHIGDTLTYDVTIFNGITN